LDAITPSFGKSVESLQKVIWNQNDFPLNFLPFFFTLLNSQDFRNRIFGEKRWSADFKKINYIER